MSRVTKGGFPSSLLSAYISVCFVFWVHEPPFDNVLPYSSTITFPKTLTCERQRREFQSGMLLSLCRPYEVECLAALHSAVGEREHGHGVGLPIASLFCLSCVLSETGPRLSRHVSNPVVVLRHSHPCQRRFHLPMSQGFCHNCCTGGRCLDQVDRGPNSLAETKPSFLC
jgi:hypothetical protein